MMRKVFRFALVSLGGLVCLLATIWAVGALYFDLPIAWLRATLALIYGGTMLAALLFVKGRGRAMAIMVAGFAVVLAWWFTIKPSNDGNWQPDVAQLAWAEVNGDRGHVAQRPQLRLPHRDGLHAALGTRTVRISQVTGIDLAINYWGSPGSHIPLLASSLPPLRRSAFLSRRERNRPNLLRHPRPLPTIRVDYVVADQRDVIRVRTNYRHGEDIYLYRTTVTPAQARERFHEYIRSLNEIRDHPRWYNAITTNCTTSIRDQHPTAERIPWDWRILLNGKGDELMFERHTIVTAGLPFSELKARSLIDQRANAADAASNFSELIRVGLPLSENKTRRHHASRREFLRGAIRITNFSQPEAWLTASQRALHGRIRGDALLNKLIEFSQINRFDEMMLESSLAGLSDIFFHPKTRQSDSNERAGRAQFLH